MFCTVAIQPSLGSPADAVEEKVEVALRLIDVTVVDRQRRPLVGLEAENFVVSVDGSERTIRSFDAAAGSSDPVSLPIPASSALPAEQSSGRGGRWIVICLDADRIPNNYRKVVLQTARAMVVEGQSDDRFAIALLQGGNLRFIQPFAPTAEVNLSVLDNPGMLLGREADLRRRIDEVVGLIRSCAEARDQDGCAATRSEEFLAVARRNSERGIRALRGLVSAMAPLPGRKALVWFSNGFVLQPGQVVLAAITRELTPAPQLLSRLQYGEVTDFGSLLADATEARVSFFALRAGHNMSHALRSAEHAGVRRPLAGEAGNAYKLANSMSEETLRDTAEATGGSVIFTPLGPDSTIGLLDRMDGVYTLGVEVLAGDSSRSKVKVKLRDRKGKVQVRRRFPEARGKRSSFVATLEVLPASGGNGVVLTVDLSNVSQERDKRSATEFNRLAVYARIRGADGPVLDDWYAIVEVPPSENATHLFRHPIVFDVPPGEYTVDVSVSDLVGHGRTSVTVKTGSGN